MSRSWWLPVTAALLSALTFLVAKDSLTDDAYITLDYARNLAVHGDWALIPGRPANTATSPLHVALLGFVTLLTRLSGSVHPVLALGIVNVGVSAVFGWAWSRMRLPAVAQVLGIALVLLNPLLLSALGMEVLLIAAMLTLLVAFVGRPGVFGPLAGLTLLTRLDLVVFVVLIGAASAAVRRKLPQVVGWCALVALPWLVFSWLYFGSAVPDTLVIKQLQRSFGGPGYLHTGLDFMRSSNPVVALSFAPAELGVLAVLAVLLLRRRFDPFVALGLGALAYCLLYALLRVPPYHWYFVPPVTALSAAAAGIAGQAAKWPRAGALTLTALLVAGYAPAFLVPLPWQAPPFFGNWASARDYARVGHELAARVGDRAVGAPGEIGTLAYFCDCTIVDGFSDPGLLAPQIRQRIDNASPVVAWLFRLDYTRFQWSKPPIRLDYQLRYAPGPGPWQVCSAAKGIGHLTLEPSR
ncbi:hypothetical protein FHX82_000417 [Amycolatopsis bartoniae]|uniref:Glycosyltransferase RgtA/B/C/D-like domain-containing protein n=1 Tax=Amycolatopsis bartoniae TaxID=941986 RepID=A0A8H9J198_9PSEU|nr:hypothetical protein [Amycolatopsis bartoniae]MBB2933397.1 hypothetical protein [Amycolatopsis bartoniae]GHF59173.1 hypothetical protein GCM10017566_35810 [Amycolatopsis bartoniae]